MTIINHLFNPGDTVYVITGGESVSTANMTPCPIAIERGVVVVFTATELITTTTLMYSIRVADDNGTTEFVETDIFATLAAAITAYQLRLT